MKNATRVFAIAGCISVVFAIPLIFITILPILLVPYSFMASIFIIIFSGLPDGINIILSMFSSYLLFVAITSAIFYSTIYRTTKNLLRRF